MCEAFGFFFINKEQSWLLSVWWPGGVGVGLLFPWFFHTHFRNLPVLFSAPVDSVLLFITFHSFGLFFVFGKCSAVESGAGGRTDPKQRIHSAPSLPRTPLHSLMREDPEMPSICFPSSDLSKEPSDLYDDEIFLYVLPPCSHRTKECSLSSSPEWLEEKHSAYQKALRIP